MLLLRLCSQLVVCHLLVEGLNGFFRFRVVQPDVTVYGPLNLLMHILVNIPQFSIQLLNNQFACFFDSISNLLIAFFLKGR